jgi:3-isopropylmalate/(R)-2-methylmalate dehydratase small subunit
MRRVDRIVGTMLPLDRANVDTDQIVPKQFLKRVERSGFGAYLFHDWAHGPDGSPDPQFVLNLPQYADAVVLLAGANFGCGSSREHAVWALEDRGFRAVIAPSFGDIFRNNCHKVGLLPVVLPQAAVARLMELAREPRPPVTVSIDLEGQTVRAADLRAGFEIDAFVKHCLLEGLDEIGLIEQQESEIAAYERRRPDFKPVTV